MAKAFTIEQLKRRARSFLPKIIFDVVEGGVGAELALRRNREAFDSVSLIPTALIDCRDCRTATEIFGHAYGAPFGVAPMGLANIVRAGTDEALAAAAAKANLPYVLSTAGSTELERITEVAPKNTWFQLYVGREPKITDDILARVERAGVSILLVTIDVPTAGRRVRDLTNGMTIPFRPRLSSVLDLAAHPRWLLQAVSGGQQRFRMLDRYSGSTRGSLAHASYVAHHLSSGRLDWETIRHIRGLHKGNLVLKGVLNPKDARRAKDLGVDGLVVSNHGGRQLDAAPSSLEVLPSIRAAVGARMPILLDSGVMSGEDIVKALAYGADFVFLGRAFLYGVAGLGLANGPRVTIEILLDEIRNTLIHLGCPNIAALKSEHVWRTPRSAGDHSLAAAEGCASIT